MPRIRDAATYELLDSDFEKIGLTMGSFDNQARFFPNHQVGAESMQGAWLNTQDLSKNKTSDYQPSAERRIKAIGKPTG